MYLILICPKCGKLLLANSSQKTRKCPYCEKRILLTKAVKVARAKTAREASTVIQELKQKRHEII